MIVLGLILILLGVMLPLPPLVETCGVVLFIAGIVLLLLGGLGHQVGGRRYWY